MNGNKQYTALAGLLVSVFLLSVSATAQDMVEVARRQMLAGMTENARKLISSALSSGTVTDQRKVAYYQALLVAEGEEASGALARLADGGPADESANHALERLGDLYYMRGGYNDARTFWQRAYGTADDPAVRSRLLTKMARAAMKASQYHGALANLRQAAETADRNVASFWTGMAHYRAGDREKAGETFMEAYTAERHRYSLAALYYLFTFYGGGESNNAADWRKRWQQSSEGTLFASAVPPAAVSSSSAGSAAGGYSVQLGAFSERAHADKLVARMRSLGLEPVVLGNSADGLYRVRVRGLKSEAEVRRVEQLLRRHRIEYHVIKPGG